MKNILSPLGLFLLMTAAYAATNPPAATITLNDFKTGIAKNQSFFMVFPEYHGFAVFHHQHRLIFYLFSGHFIVCLVGKDDAILHDFDDGGAVVRRRRRAPGGRHHYQPLFELALGAAAASVPPARGAGHFGAARDEHPGAGRSFYPPVSDPPLSAPEILPAEI